MITCRDCGEMFRRRKKSATIVVAVVVVVMAVVSEVAVVVVVVVVVVLLGIVSKGCVERQIRRARSRTKTWASISMTGRGRTGATAVTTVATRITHI